MVTSAIAARSRVRRFTPLKAAAALGILLAGIQAYLLVKWVASPNFAEVSSGPTVPPTWMKVAILPVEVLSTAMVVVLVYRFVVLPFRRERRIGFNKSWCSKPCEWYVRPTELLLPRVVRLQLLLLQQGHTDGGNARLAILRRTGAQIAWPIFCIPALYAGMFLGIPVLGCVVMRRARSRWPQLPNIGLLTICFITIVVIDIVLEGVVVMRLGIYDHTGPSIPLLDSYYSHNALANIVLVAVTITAVTALRYFRNDRGETLVERGSEQFGRSPARSSALRFFAVFAAMQMCLLLGYHVPMAIWTTITPTSAWHEDMQQNSYLNDHICGVGTAQPYPQ